MTAVGSVGEWTIFRDEDGYEFAIHGEGETEPTVVVTVRVEDPMPYRPVQVSLPPTGLSACLAEAVGDALHLAARTARDEHHRLSMPFSAADFEGRAAGTSTPASG